MNPVNATAASDDESRELIQMRSAIEGAITAIMMVDRDLVVTYANQSAFSLLRENEAVLQSLYPGFKVDDIIGTCIDTFHKKPSHQRNILDNPDNFPYSTDISIGPLIINLNISAQIDDNGNYIGTTLEWQDVTKQRELDNLNADYKGQIDAIGKSQAVIEFNLDGTIINANENFLQTVGYTLDEIQGKHHRMFTEAEYANSPEYRLFWEKLNRGEYGAGEYKRIGKGGKEVWIQASYNPIMDLNGKPFKVVKYATDVTADKLLNADVSGQVNAIGKSQAVIEFNMDGTIITANDNFLNTLGYSLTDIQGQHHNMFADSDYAQSHEYKLFWEKLNRGEYDSGEYKRIGKGGKEVWIQASYNPIIDLNGKPFKVVKYATDITGQKNALTQIAKLIDSVKHGDLGQRIDTTHYDGFVKQLSDDINSMMDIISAPLRETARIVKKLADGDLTDRASGEFEGEFATLSTSVNACLDNLSKMATEILDGSASLSGSAGEIAKGNEDLSQRTEEQASSLEETASSMEELTGTVKQTADNAREADQLANKAHAEAEKGGLVVTDAITAMSEINASSKKIADIIGVIDEIAFQTNLLALNAAVEAARAGEQGRGFAVVASEVRNLAQRSAGAAKEIKGLINDSVQKVEEGSRLVDKSGETLTSIVAAVQKVNSIIAEISSASQEQSAGIEQVNKAIVQMDEVTQQNAALVEQASAVSESMSDESNALAELMTFFKVK
ncbi:MAG: methyl-accepting chemotaxis protein [Gammaproteobacteria bacterium]|nr:methyl-accepting chemotaxis protein [Gammaproteobacteria bacterium]